jgi:branched-chain amino acid aminotransferase
MKSKNDKFDYPVNEKLDPGPVCQQLLTTLKGIQMGKVNDQFGWNFKVTEAPKDFLKTATNGGVHGAVDELP